MHRVPARILANVLFLCLCAVLAAGYSGFAQADEVVHLAGPDGVAWTLEPGEHAGQWRLSAGGDAATPKNRTLEVPPGWRLEGTWSMTSTPLGDLVVTELSDTQRVVMLVGKGDAAADEVLWVGVRGTDLEVRLEDADGDGTLQLLRGGSPLPHCGEWTRWLTVARYDAKTKAFDAPTSAPQAAELTLQSAPFTGSDPDLVSRDFLRFAVARPTWSGSWEQESVAALSDGDDGTFIEGGADGTYVFVASSDAFPLRALYLKSDRSKGGMRVLLPGAAAELTGVEAATMTEVLLPQGTACAIVELGPKTRLAELKGATEWDQKPVDEALEALFLLAVQTADRETRVGYAGLLARHTQWYMERLTRAAETATTVDELEILRQLSQRGDFETFVRTQSAIGLNPAADDALVAQVSKSLAGFPKVEARVLATKLKTVGACSDEALELAGRLSQLALERSWLPLLEVIDACAEDEGRSTTGIAAAVEVGPSLVPHLFHFIGAEGMSDATRLALLRVLLRLAPAAVAEGVALDVEGVALDDASASAGTRGDSLRATPVPGSERNPIEVLASSERLAVRLLMWRVVAEYGVAFAPGVLEAGLERATVDIERAQIVRTWAALFPSESRMPSKALGDEWPEVRLAAAEALAHFAGPDAQVDAQLRAFVDQETWPDARSMALVGLGRRHHPDTLALASAWLDDETLGGNEKHAAAEALALAGAALALDDLVRWVGNDTLKPSSRRSLVATYLADENADENALIELLRGKLGDEREDDFLAGFAESVLYGLRRRGSERLPALLLEVFDQGDELLKLRAAELMGFYDSPENRERLEALRGSANGSLSDMAEVSLDRLDGVVRKPKVDWGP